MQLPGTTIETMSHGKRHPLRALTSLRFFAAAYIIVMHTDVPSLIRLPWPLVNLFHSGYTAVTLFFALSGFILTYNYSHIDSQRSFWISRFARIYPAYLLALVAWIFLSIGGSEFRNNHIELPAIIASIFLVQAWLPAIATAINPMGWTLSVEAFLYAVFPFTNPLCRRATRTGMALFAAFALTLSVAPYLIVPFHRGFALYLANIMDNTPPIFRLCTFVIGSIAGVSFSRSHRRIRGLLPISLLTSIALLCWAPGDLGHPLKTMLLSFTYTGIIYGLATVETGFMTSPWLILGGEISYSMYILQFVVFRIVNKAVATLIPGHLGLGVLLRPLGLILVSWFTFRFLEMPARSSIRKHLLPVRSRE